MRYRPLGRTGMMVSEIALGCEHFEGKDYDHIKGVFDEAFAQGINLFDMLNASPELRTHFAKAIGGKRDIAVIQGHIGSILKDGQYAMSNDFGQCKAAFEDMLVRLDTDYIDIGMLHFIDTDEDFNTVFNGELIEYAKELKAKGVIKAIGLDSHIPGIAKRAVETGLIDVVMFSINPAFDLLPGDIGIDDLFINEKHEAVRQNHIDPDRMALYQLCERNGVGITVMKTYMAGQLLNAEQSPFGFALTPVQCIHYALTRPGVASAIIGCTTAAEIREAAAYNTASDSEKDFSAVFSKTFTAQGKCVYCNHCLPCPARIDIGLVNKYLDLAKTAETIPPTVTAHYNALPNHAGDCTACGACQTRCPFGVAVMERMQEAKKCFKR